MYPRCFRLGLIEASPSAKSAAIFRKPYPRCFRLGLIEANLTNAHVFIDESYPRCFRLGLIEASQIMMIIAVMTLGIRGVFASASLKPSPWWNSLYRGAQVSEVFSPRPH